jgi:hypothetical protein
VRRGISRQSRVHPRKDLWLVLAAVSAIVLIAIGGYVVMSSKSDVSYRVAGDGSAASINYETGDNTEMLADTDLPWTITLDEASVKNVSATAATGASRINCEIILGGQVVSTNTSFGSGVMVDCAWGSQR